MDTTAIAITALNAALLVVALIALALIFWRRDTAAASSADTPHPPESGSATQDATSSDPTRVGPAHVEPTPIDLNGAPPATSLNPGTEPEVEVLVDVSSLGLDRAISVTTAVLAELDYQYDERSPGLDFIGPDQARVAVRAPRPSSLLLAGRGHVLPYLAYRLIAAGDDVGPVLEPTASPLGQ